MKTKKKSKLTNDSSKQIDEHFHRVSFREIKILWNVLRGLSLTRTDFVRAKFLQDALHYSDVADFLKQLGLLHEAKGQIARKENLGETNEEMKFALAQFLLTRNTSYRTNINNFLGNFESVDGNFEIVMDSERRQQFGGLRNLLLELEFLEHDFNKPRYWISSQHLATFIAAKNVSSISPLELQAVLRAREELGHKAELVVLKFERARLRSYSDLVKRIKHIASENVGAGYDVLSFTKLANRGGFSDRLIEVKAVSSIDFKFYWSRNEIETARIHGQNYFLYLVPVSKDGFDMRKIKIIQNPFEQVYLATKSWLRLEELISFWPNEVVVDAK
jgi:hypothetical protein